MNTVIVGGGLCGLLLAHQMRRAGHAVTLVEARDQLGGSHRRPMLTFCPATNLNMELCEWLRAHSPQPVNFTMAEHRPQIFTDGRWTSFAGFLDAEFQTRDELAPMSNAHEILLEPGVDQIVRAWIEQLPVSAQLQAEVTEIKIVEGEARELVINGDKTLKAERIFFTAAPTLLNKLIVGESLPGKHRSRLAKASTWTAVALELEHAAPLAEPGGIRVFSHSAKEFEPVFGRIEGAISRWVTLVHSEREAEHEFTGQCIRHIKRQLKRAWPEAFDAKPTEKIYVYPAEFGQNSLKTPSPWQFPEIPNLFLVHATLASQAGFLGAIEAVKAVASMNSVAGTKTFMLSDST